MARLHRSISISDAHLGDVSIVIWTDDDDLRATTHTSR